MKYSIIYQFDCPRDCRVIHWQPPQLRLWTLTEGDEQYDYGYLADEGPSDDPEYSRWRKGKHRKYTGVLTQKQFDAFISETGLEASDVETMGMLGSPHGDMWAPAMSFSNPDVMNARYYDDEPIAILSAYVCPLVEPARPRREYNQRDWDRVTRAMLNKYGDSWYRSKRAREATNGD